MSDLSKWTPSEMLEPVRRFLDGDLTIAPSIKIEQFQEGNTLVVRAEVPGIDPDKDVDVSVSEGVLNISVEREEKSEHKSKNGYRSEFRYGSSMRSIALPAGAKEEDITATYKDGVLEVRAPAPKRPRQKSPRRSGSTVADPAPVGLDWQLDWNLANLKLASPALAVPARQAQGYGQPWRVSGPRPWPAGASRRPRRRGQLPSGAPGGASRRRGTGPGNYASGASLWTLNNRKAAIRWHDGVQTHSVWTFGTKELVWDCWKTRLRS